MTTTITPKQAITQKEARQEIRNGHTMEQLGQLAYTTHHEAVVAFVEPGERRSAISWDHLSIPERAAWEAAAFAVITHAARPATKSVCLTL
jgi:hypothetical protein